MSVLNITKTVPVVGEYDVVVVGGGCAGWVAAISAARAGLRTALVERYGFLGGTATAGYVIPISGFFFRGERVVGGIAWEFIERMQEKGVALPEMPKGHISANIEYYKRIAEQMVTEAGVELYTNAWMSGAEFDTKADQRTVTHIVIESKNGTEALAARCFIDATGDADLCAMAGVPMLARDKTTPQQPLSLCFVLSGVDITSPLMRSCIHHNGIDGEASCNDRIRAMLLECAERGEIPQFGGPWFNTMLTGDSLTVNMTRTAADATNRADMTAAELRLRCDMFTFVDLLRARYPEFAKCEIVASAINAGVRETRHIRGVQTVTLADFAQGRQFACPVAHAAHPMDIHDSTSAAQKLIPLERNAYVPHGALVTHEYTNLIAAGRCISAEPAPYASLRVQGTLMSIGEGAGLMAALHLRDGAPVNALSEDALRGMIDERHFVL